MPEESLADRTERTSLDGTEIFGMKHAGVWKRITGSNILASVNLSGLGLGTMATQNTSAWVPQTQPVETVTGTTYTLVAADIGKLKRFTSASSIALYVPTDAAVTIPIGSYIDILVDGAGQMTVASTATATNTYLHLDGTSGAVAYTPNAASVQVTTNYEMVWRMRMVDTNPTPDQAIWAKWTDTTDRSYRAFMNLNYRTYHEMTNTGSAVYGAAITSNAITPVDNTWYWFRYRWTDTSRIDEVWYAADQSSEPATWTSYGVSNGGGSTSPFAGTARLTIGSGSTAATANMFAGDISHMYLRKSHGGANSWSLSPELWTTGSTWTSATGQTNTLAGTASIASDGATGVAVYPSGLTLKSRAQYSRLALQKVAADRWSLLGDLAAS